MKRKYWLFGVASVGLAVALSACSSDTTDEKADSKSAETKKEEKAEPKKEKEQAKETSAKEETEAKGTSTYKADDAYNWLKESGLVTGEAEDVTSKFTGSPGLVKALRTTEADIFEYDTEKHAKKYHNPDLNSYAVNNIYVLIKQGQDNADNFVKVLEVGQGVKELGTTYASDAQKAFVESMDKADFVTYVDNFYALPAEERTSTYDSYIYDKEVTWTGTIADVNTISDSIIVYGKDDYAGQDWSTISTDKKEMIPYTVIIELKDKTAKKGLKNGDKVTFKGVVGARGDKNAQFNWKLYDGEIIK